MPNTIAENLQRLIDAKEDIADAITAKGGTVGANDGLEEFASDIATIPDYKPTLTDLIERDITSIVVPDTVTSIGAYAFAYCTNLTTITIPSTVTSIGYNAFSYCDKLTLITINKAPNSISGAPWGALYASVIWTG